MVELKSLLFVSSLLLMSLPAYLLAAPGERGRLPDGRAYRVDAEGNEIVDYIAELELNVDALNTKLLAVENELIEQRGRCSGTSSAKSKVEEVDLLAKQQAAVASNAEAAKILEQSFIEQCEIEKAKLLQEQGAGRGGVQQELVETKAELAGAKAELTGVKAELTGRDDTIRELQNQRAKLSGDKESLLQRLSALEAQSESTRAKDQATAEERLQLRAQNDTLSARIRELEASEASLSEQVEMKEAELLQVRAANIRQAAEIDTRDQQLVGLRAELRRLQVEVAENNNLKRASLSPELKAPTTKIATSSSSFARAAIPQKKAPSVDLGATRKSLLSKLSKLEKQAVSRNQEFKRYNSVPGRPLKLSAKDVSPALRLMKRQIPNAGASQLRAYAKELRDIERSIQSDLKTVKRLAR